jgi:hypothetical protein
MVGLVTTTYLSHATPAAFGAHDTSRDNTTAIAADLLNQTRPNVMLGGGGNGLSVSGAQTAGYSVATSKAAMLGLDVNNLAFVSGQFGTTYMPYELDGNAAGGAYATNALPDLSEMTALALDVLDNDPDGFFLMVEGGLIDQACHANDLQRAIGEVIEFEETVAMVYNWAQTHGNTLLLVTADHETGGLSNVTGNGRGAYPTVTWTSTGHTGVNVPIYAYGPGAQAVVGVLDNTDIFALTTPSAPSSDATVSFQQNSGGYLGAKDTQVRQASADTSYGAAGSLNVDADEPAGSGSDVQALLRFDNIFGTGAGQVPIDKQIVSAQLQLQVTNGGNSVELHRMLGSWLDSVTWNGLGTGVQADGVEAMMAADAITGAVATGTLTIDVTAALQAWQASPSSNYGWAILPTGSDGIDFDSAEGTTHPRLIVTYQTGTPNQAPVAGDDSTTGDEDSAMTIGILANDSDADGDRLIIASVAQAAHGAVAVNPDGTVTYTPHDNYNGSDSFEYTVSDGRGGYGVGTVSVTIDPVYDAPVAMADSFATTEGTAVTIPVLANDRNPDGLALSLALSQAPAHGTVQVNADRTLIYMPTTGFAGNDTFAYTISFPGPDGQVGTSTAQVVVAVNPGPQTLYAIGESNAAATVAGSCVDTRQSDDRYESLTEVAQRKKNVLDHTWTFVLNGGDAASFSAEAHGSGIDDGFTFQYSIDGTVWTSMLTVTATSDVVQSYSLPAGLSGNVYVRVVDTNHGPSETALDTLYVDAMWITTIGGTPVLPTVAVEVTDAGAAEQDGDPGTFTITRTDTSGSLTVYYTLGGTAENGADYSAIDNAVVYSHGEASKVITIVPTDDGVSEAGGETVTLTIDPNAAYEVDARQSAILTIADNDGPVSYDYQPVSQQTLLGKVETSPLVMPEVLAEQLDAKKSCLEHTWVFEIGTTAASASFNVEAWHSGTEDDFLFQYSLNGTDWVNMLTVTKTSDDNAAQTYELPSNLTGTVYVRVLDTNRAVNKKVIDRLYIDQLFIRCV